MSNPEQQPNINSNLQTLETEVSLTKQEIEEFRRLPKEEQDRQKDEKLIRLKDLQNKLDQEIQEAIRIGKIDEVRNLTELLQKGLTDLEDQFEATESLENILSIDRSADILKFIGWSGASIEAKDTDTRSTSLTEIDLSKLKLDTSWLPEGKSSINGEKRLEALKSIGNIRLDAQILIALKKLSEEKLNKKMEIIATANDITLDDLKKKAIFFDGTIIRVSGGSRQALYLRWAGSWWSWLYGSLSNDWDGSNPSLVLAS